MCLGRGVKEKTTKVALTERILAAVFKYRVGLFSESGRKVGRLSFRIGLKSNSIPCFGEP